VVGDVLLDFGSVRYDIEAFSVVQVRFFVLGSRQQLLGHVGGDHGCEASEVEVALFVGVGKGDELLDLGVCG
jgi:hypothetical protein